MKIYVKFFMSLIMTLIFFLIKALREIQNLQKIIKLLILKLSFQRLIYKLIKSFIKENNIR